MDLHLHQSVCQPLHITTSLINILIYQTPSEHQRLRWKPGHTKPGQARPNQATAKQERAEPGQRTRVAQSPGTSQTSLETVQGHLEKETFKPLKCKPGSFP